MELVETSRRQAPRRRHVPLGYRVEMSCRPPAGLAGLLQRRRARDGARRRRPPPPVLQRSRDLLRGGLAEASSTRPGAYGYPSRDPLFGGADEAEDVSVIDDRLERHRGAADDQPAGACCRHDEPGVAAQVQAQGADRPRAPGRPAGNRRLDRRCLLPRWLSAPRAHGLPAPPPRGGVRELGGEPCVSLERPPERRHGPGKRPWCSTWWNAPLPARRAHGPCARVIALSLPETIKTPRRRP